MRGGISYIAHRHAEANNKYMKNFDPERESSYIMYLDANNLYGWAMSQSLPYSDFKWTDPENVILENYTDDTKKGIILEVDLEYPDYLLAPQKILVSDHMLSPYSKELKEARKISSREVHKLVPNLLDKEKYILHYRNLQLYFSLGLRLKKIYRALEFAQKRWMKPYIDFNTEKRKNAKNSFEKYFLQIDE